MLEKEEFVISHNEKLCEPCDLCFSRTCVLADIRHTYKLSMRKSAIFLKETYLHSAWRFDCALSRVKYDVTLIVVGAKRIY